MKLNSRLLPRGTAVTGKWNGRTYRIERLLGEGANGTVYLVREGLRSYAMKIGFEALDHQSEINALRTIDKHIRREDPFLIDVDDYEAGGQAKPIPFYVMKYVDGKRIHEFIDHKGLDWVYPVGLHLLYRLHQLHRHGWIFGDLKMENVMVRKYGEVELVDHGGVTRKGEAVRQFTESYDRGYWGAGSRTADETYDLFSFAVLLLQVMYPQQRIKEPGRLLPQNRDVTRLLEPLRQDRRCSMLLPVFQAMLAGQLTSSRQAIEAWREAGRSHGRWQSGSQRKQTGRKRIGRRSISSMIGGWLALSVAVFMLTLYLLVQ